MNFNFDFIGQPHLYALNNSIVNRLPDTLQDITGDLMGVQRTIAMIGCLKRVKLTKYISHINAFEPRDHASYMTWPHAKLIINFSADQLVSASEFIDAWLSIESLKL